jgi:sugar lactone lactonase YvrE
MPAHVDGGLPDSTQGDTLRGPPQLSLFAGALGGVGNVDGVGSAARFSGPAGVASDGAGHLYVADTNNQLIRQLTLSTGAVTTIAGSGQAGVADGVGTAASFENPQGMFLTGSTLYVGQVFEIRKIDLTTNTVSTVSVTPAPAYPFGIVGDASGTNLYIADSASNRYWIDKVVLATGALTVLAGGAVGEIDGTGAAAGFVDPEAITTNGISLFVVDKQACTIRKVVIATGVVTTLAGGTCGHVDGTGTAAQFDTPAGISFDSAGDLYVSEKAAIRKIVIATGVVSTVAGNASEGSADGVGMGAFFSLPTGLTPDGFGNFDIADTANGTIRQLAPISGTVTTIAGLAAQVGTNDGVGTGARFSVPGHLASDGAGHVFVAQGTTVREATVSTAQITTVPTISGTFGIATGVATDGTNLYVSDRQQSVIYKVNIASGAASVLAGTKFSAVEADGTGTAAAFHLPWGLSLDPSGNPLYVGDCGGDTIRRVDVQTGVVTTIAGTAETLGNVDGTGTAAQFFCPSSLALDGAGNLYIGDSNNDTIRKMVVSSRAVTTIAGTPGGYGSVDGTGPAASFEGPTQLAVDAAGILYVTDYAGTVRRIDPSTQVVTTLVGMPDHHSVIPGLLPAELNNPAGIVALPGSRLLISDENALLLEH